MKNIALILVCLLVLTSCATIRHGEFQDVTFTSSPAGADVWVDNNFTGKTPMMASLKRKIDPWKKPFVVMQWWLSSCQRYLLGRTNSAKYSFFRLSIRGAILFLTIIRNSSPEKLGRLASSTNCSLSPKPVSTSSLSPSIITMSAPPSNTWAKSIGIAR